MSMFKKATKSSRKLRMALYGLSGGGKTFSSLSIATGLGKKIAVIDTERHSSELYSDRFDFDVCPVDNPVIESYVEAIKAAGKAGYEVLIIDSMTHAWDELIEEVERIAKAKYKGNTWSAWSEGTPKQKKFINAILDFPGHIIVTMRSKMEWTVEETKNGKSRPVKIGLAPQQGKNISYEFDLLAVIDDDHNLMIEKDRTGKFQDKIISKPGKAFGEELNAWFHEIPDVVKEKSQIIPEQTTTESQAKSEPSKEPTQEPSEAKSSVHPVIQKRIDECASVEELNKLWESYNGKYTANTAVINAFKTRKKNVPVQ